MARSKNNPKERNTQASKDRICDLCGKSGVIDTEVQRVLRVENSKKKFIWKCKAGC